MTALARIEPMSGAFTKWHVDGGCVLHRFTAPDTGDPHDHPWSFDTQILTGGYVEEVFTLNEDGGGWTRSLHHRRPGEVHHVDARHIHRIVALPAGECWTVIRPGDWRQVSGFWRLAGGHIERRDWNGEWRRWAWA